MKTLAVSNQKGGTGKSATAHALGAALADRGRRILLVDCDPQSSLTQSCGVHDTEEQNLADVLGGAQPGRLALSEIVRNLSPRLDLAPADIALAGAELGMVQRLGREMLIRRALATVASRYDLAILDCPPSLGLLTLAGLVAADGVITPCQPQAADLRGVKLFTDTLETIRAELNPSLVLLGVLITFYDNRLVHHRQAIETLRAAGLPILPVLIGRSIKVAEAAGAAQSVVDYEPANPQATAYKQLAEYIYEWLKSDPR